MTVSPNDFLVTDQVAIVTGGGGGLGRAIALGLASGGADIVIADISPERCEETVARVEELGRRAIGIPTDMTDTARVAAMVAQADAHFGRVDILVNNAGGVSRRPFLDSKEHNWRKLIDLNLVSMLAATAAAAPIIIRGGRGGSIINVSSIEASRAAPRFSVYAACKAGMNNFTRTLALELSEHRIRVNALAPDFIETPGTRGNISGPVDRSKWLMPTPEQQAGINRRIPLGGPGADVEAGRAALFLASAMSSYITGVILPIDGGAWANMGWVRMEDGWRLGDTAV